MSLRSNKFEHPHPSLSRDLSPIPVGRPRASHPELDLASHIEEKSYLMQICHSLIQKNLHYCQSLIDQFCRSLYSSVFPNNKSTDIENIETFHEHMLRTLKQYLDKHLNIIHILEFQFIEKVKKIIPDFERDIKTVHKFLPSHMQNFETVKNNFEVLVKNLTQQLVHLATNGSNIVRTIKKNYAHLPRLPDDVLRNFSQLHSTLLNHENHGL